MNEVEEVYRGSDADKTRALYLRLIEHGQVGDVAVNLLRACKASERAKQYRGGRYVRAAYDKKDWSIGELSKALVIHAADLGIAWGWGRDEKAINFENVLYVELPAGQVSFHTSQRREGPDYSKPWDGAKNVAASRIIEFATAVLDGSLTMGEAHEPRQDRTQRSPTTSDAGAEVRDQGQQESFGF